MNTWESATWSWDACLAIALSVAILCSGCSLWVSDKPAISKGDIHPIDPYDGSKVYPLNVIVLGSAQRFRNLDTPLRLLERRMSEQSEYGVIRAADCGILACYANDMPLAARALERAIALSEAAMIDESQVSRVAGVSGSERNKVFAGEPHEVAILYIFRGIVFLAENDPENAKSCFLKASLTDAMALQDKDRSNWLTADILAALSFRLYGNDIRARDHIAMIKRSYSQAPASNGWVDGTTLAKLRKDNLTIVVLAIGNPPVKYGQGALQYLEIESKVAAVRIDDQSAWLTDNVYVQAVTRGRRNMDNILAARQKRREDMEKAGSVALGAAGAVGGLVGLAIQLIAGAAIDKAQEIDIDADNRQISAIPGKFYVWASNSVTPGHALKIELLNPAKKPIARGSVVIPNSNKQGPTVVLAWFPR